MDSEFSDASITNSVSASSGSASARRINLEPGPFVETDVHRLICKVGREGDVWHGDLEVVHGLTEAESCECFSVLPGSTCTKRFFLPMPQTKSCSLTPKKGGGTSMRLTVLLTRTLKRILIFGFATPNV
jgi:hypothetical protein